MKVMMRFGSAWHDVAEQIRAVTELGLDPRHFILVTDDSHSGTLVNDGHMNRVVRHAIEQGVEPMTAIQMATLNTAEHFGVATEVGLIAPGRYADILLIDDLAGFEVDTVIAKGVVAAESGGISLAAPVFTYPDEVRGSIHLKRKMKAEDFQLAVASNGRVMANVIGVIENQAPTELLKVEVETHGGYIEADAALDLAKVALVERHRGNGTVQLGLVRGFSLDQRCAVASTVAHDSHHMLVVGTNDADMAMAANELAEVGGGQIVVRNGEVLALVELPIAGLMSDETAEVVAEKADRLLAAFRECGCTLNNANMQLSLLALVVIPELRISDLGLVDVNRFEVVPLVEAQA
jgi:adenine deaminase